jgi:hypothetical protein
MFQARWESHNSTQFRIAENSQTRLVDDRVAGGMLGVAPGTMRKWRVIGSGPKYVKFRGAVRLIFNSWNLQRIDNTDRSALEKRLGTTFPLIAGMGRDQASAS